MTVKTLELEMSIFRLHYESVRVTVGSDCLVYKTARGYSDRAAKKANLLIETLGLELTAIPNKNHPRDSFVVQSIFNSDL